MESGQVLSRVTDGVGWITVSNPERHNALSFKMFTDLRTTLREMDASEAVRVVVVTGAGERAFMSGADISKFDSERKTAEQVSSYQDNAAAVHETLRSISTPSIAMIRGWCAGGGLAIALSCDFRIADSTARFSSPAARLGIGYTIDNIGSMAMVTGLATAKEILLTGRRYSAEDALRRGIVHDVVEPQELESYTAEYAQRIVGNAPLSIIQMKKVFAELAKEPSKRDLAACAELFERCYASEDYQEGRRAFMEKRKPQWRGR